MKYYVKYRVQKFGAERTQGPYDTMDSAHSHAEDIRTYEGIEYAVVVDEDMLEVRGERI